MENKIKEIIKGTEYNKYIINTYSIEVYGSEFRLHISHDTIEKIKDGITTWHLNMKDIEIVNALICDVNEFKKW